MAGIRISYPSNFLPGVADKFKGTMGRFLVERALPAEPGAAHKGTIFTLGAGYMLPNAHEDGKRLPGGTVQELPPVNSDGVDYRVQPYSVSRSVPKELQKRAAAMFNMTEKLGMGLLHSLKTQQDVNFLAQIVAATWIYEDTLAGGELWNVAATAVPLENLRALVDAIRPYTGGAPLSLIAPTPALSALYSNAQIRGVMATDASRAYADEQWFLDAIGRPLGITQVFEAHTVVNTSGDPDEPAIAYADDDFVWVGVLPGAPASGSDGDYFSDYGAFARVVEYAPNLQEDWDFRTQSTVITGEFSEAIVLVDTNMGGIIRNVI